MAWPTYLNENVNALRRSGLCELAATLAVSEHYNGKRPFPIHHFHFSQTAVPTQHLFISQNLQQPVAFHVHRFCFARRPFPIQPLRHHQQLPQPARRSKPKTSAAVRSFCRDLELVLPDGCGAKRPFSPTNSFLNVQPARSTGLNFAPLTQNGG